METQRSYTKKWDAPMIIGTVIGAAIVAASFGYVLHWIAS